MSNAYTTLHVDDQITIRVGYFDFEGTKHVDLGVDNMTLIFESVDQFRAFVDTLQRKADLSFAALKDHK